MSPDLLDTYSSPSHTILRLVADHQLLWLEHIDLLKAPFVSMAYNLGARRVTVDALHRDRQRERQFLSEYKYKSRR